MDSFFLNVNTPEEGEDLIEHLSKKYGSEMVARFNKPNNPLSMAGSKLGITFNPNRRVIPTMRCHRLMEFVNTVHPEKSTDVMMAMFHRYFEEALDVSKPAMLIDIGTACGIPAAETMPIVESNDKLRDEVLAEYTAARNRFRVSGVPFFVVESQESSKSGKPAAAFSGAQPTEVIAEILQEAVDM